MYKQIESLESRMLLAAGAIDPTFHDPNSGADNLDPFEDKVIAPPPAKAFTTPA